MTHILKKIVIVGIIVAAFYFLLAYHYIILDNWFPPKMLKKSELTLKYTFFSTKGKTVETVLSVPELWNDGIGDLLLQEGKITEEELEMFTDKMREKEY